MCGEKLKMNWCEFTGTGFGAHINYNCLDGMLCSVFQYFHVHPELKTFVSLKETIMPNCLNMETRGIYSSAHWWIEI